jgi:tetratricopeptide (TPR) repeat protein
MARYQIPWCLYNIGKETEALAEFSGYLKDYPKADNALDVIFWFAEYYDAKKKYDKAREYYSVIVDDHPDSGMVSEAMYQLAGILYEEGKYDEALARFRELVSRDPASDYAGRSYRKMARIKRDLKDYDQAAEYLAKALNRDNNELNAQIQYEIAECAEEKGDLAKAVEEYLKVTYLYSNGAFWSVRATLASAKLFERLEKFEEARRLYEKLADMDVEESAFAKQRLEWIKWRNAK